MRDPQDIRSACRPYLEAVGTELNNPRVAQRDSQQAVEHEWPPQAVSSCFVRSFATTFAWLQANEMTTCQSQVKPPVHGKVHLVAQPVGIAMENFNEHCKGIFDGHGPVPDLWLGRYPTLCGWRAIFVYQLAFLYRFEHDLELCVGFKAFLKSA